MGSDVHSVSTALSQWLSRKRAVIVARAMAFIVIIAVIDWRLDVNISFGFLYLFPMLMMGSALSRLQIAAVAAGCTLLDQWFDPFPFVAAASVPQAILVFAAFLGSGLFAYEVIRNRQAAEQHLKRIQSEMAARCLLEEQLEALIESSPAAVITLDDHGRVLLANHAAHKMLELSPGRLSGRHIETYLPTLSRVPPLGETEQVFRTAMRCRGARENGQAFVADVWFSTYRTASGPRLAAMIIDSSEELREREELGLNQLLTGSRILVSAVWHEIRNVCGAISVVCTNLLRDKSHTPSDDLRALGTLVESLNQIAATELKQHSEQELDSIDLCELLQEFRIVIEPSLRESGIHLCWQVPVALPYVWAERQSLLQVLLNVTRNSERAMENMTKRELTIMAASENHGVVVRIEDTGPGVRQPERLFQAFQPGADATGLGLFVSRSFMRSFRGDLLYERGRSGSCFIVQLSAAPQSANELLRDQSDADTHSVAG